MPRRRRLQPGQTYGGGGGGIDLGGLLLSAFGGIQANPEFGQAMPPPSDTFTGPMPAGNIPYKAKSIFDRARANEMNANYLVEQSSADKDVARELQKEQSLNPILTERTKMIGDVTNKQTQQLQQWQGIAKVLEALGLEASPENVQQYGQMNNPALFENAAQSVLARLAATQGQRKQAEFANEAFDETRDNRLSLEKVQALNNVLQEAGKTDLIPGMLQEQAILQRERPKWQAQQSQSNRFMQLGPEATLFDTQKEKPVYSQPSVFDKIQEQLDGKTGAVQQPVQPQPQQGIQVGPGYVIINGKRYNQIP